MIIEIQKDDKDILEILSILEREIFPESYYSYKMLEEMSGQTDYKILVYDKEIKGYLILHDSCDVYEIMKIGVQNDFRNKKIGKELIDFYLDRYDKNLFLEVRESNLVARTFYEKMGFVIVGKRKNYYSNGESAILMLLERN